MKILSSFGKRYVVVLQSVVAFSVLISVPVAWARVVTLTGGLSSGYEWYERQYDNDGGAINNDDKYSRFRISPLIELESLSARDEIRLSYSPSFHHDFDSSESDVDHSLSAAFNRSLSENWRLLLSDNYRLADQAEEDTSIEPGTGLQISDSEGRRRYWTNDFSLSSEYTYLADSLFSLGYSYGVYRDLDNGAVAGSEDYDRHTLSTSVGHRFNPRWKLTVAGDVVRGLYDEADLALDDDRTEYRASTTLESNLIDHHPLSLGYSFFSTVYDDSGQDDSYIHNVSFGWQWAISSDYSVNLSAGPSYAKTEGEEGRWGYNANFGLNRQIEHGSLALGVTHGFDQQNFTGTDEDGLQEYWQARANFSYQLLEPLSMGLFSSYRYEDQDTIVALPAGGTDVEAINTKTFAAGGNLSYRFLRWYTVALSYNYSQQDSEEIGDSYDDHRVALTLSYRKDLFRW